MPSPIHGSEFRLQCPQVDAILSIVIQMMSRTKKLFQRLMQRAIKQEHRLSNTSRLKMSQNGTEA
eukprot:NODE_30535_length_416_cov_0.667820.p2 GENE.NODE_30535_length_416_cov_0.667820~~NODE_30535_length_416_cov_0.667820.p2  ORF type:complete len:65 (+),score=8.04 NODE_30535_length_416_cov_0.667820:56-250(+)